MIREAMRNSVGGGRLAKGEIDFSFGGHSPSAKWGEPVGWDRSFSAHFELLDLRRLLASMNRYQTRFSNLAHTRLARNFKRCIGLWKYYFSDNASGGQVVSGLLISHSYYCLEEVTTDLATAQQRDGKGIETSVIIT